MNYLGGKSRIAGKIASLFPSGLPFVEPFCGGLNVTVQRPDYSFCNDKNKALITLYRAVQNGFELPDFVDENTYQEYKAKQDENDPLTAFIGIGCSFGAKWFGGYARNGKGDNYALRAKRSLLKKLGVCRDVVFTSEDYREFLRDVPYGLVYMDPPYKGTTEYKDRGFNSEEFYDVCRTLSKTCKVYVSEYVMPDDFKCVLEIPTVSTLEKNSKHCERMERVYTL